MIKALTAYILGSSLVFFQHNLQFINDSFKDKTHLLIFVLSIPISYLYFYSWTYFVSSSGGSAWTAKFIFFGLSYLVYPILTYVFLGESPLSFKTIVCTFLSILILLIQYKF